MAEVAPITSHAAHVGIWVCRYRREPMRMKSEAEPAIEMPSAERTELIIVIIRIFLRRGFRASCCSFRYSLSTAFNSFRNEIINSFSEILLSSKIITSQAIENSLLVTKE